MKTVDLIILGDGIIARLASLCAQYFGLSYVQLGKAEPDYELDPRSYALAPSSLKMLAILGIRFDEPRVNSIAIGFGDALTADMITIMNSDGPTMTMVDHGPLAKALKAELGAQNFIEDASPKLIISDHFATLEAHNIRGSLVVLAEGKNSKNARDLGISYTQSLYQQLAITAKLKASLPHQKVARQLFSSTGPLGILPHGSHDLSIVWSQDHEVANALMALSDQDFLQNLATKIGHYTGAIALTSKRASFPLQHITPSRLHGKRFVLAGDSAHVVHPLAGQGLNLGIRDIACLFETIMPARRIGQDIGSDDLLHAYVNWRKGDIAQITALTKSVQKFGSAAGVFAPLIKPFSERLSHLAIAEISPPSLLLNGKMI